jgi:hypothetical protein
VVEKFNSGISAAFARRRSLARFESATRAASIRLQIDVVPSICRRRREARACSAAFRRANSKSATFSIDSASDHPMKRLSFRLDASRVPTNKINKLVARKVMRFIEV